MRPQKAILLIFSFCVGFPLLPDSDAWACSCIEQVGCSFYKPEDTVFIGQVTSLSFRWWFVAQEQTAKFRVGRVLKGSVPAIASVNAGVPIAGSCGYRFQRGKTYLVHARMHKGRLETNACMRTRQIEFADRDLLLLTTKAGQPAAPVLFVSVLERLDNVKGKIEIRAIPHAEIEISDNSGRVSTHQSDANGKLTLLELQTGEFTARLLPDGPFVQFELPADQPCAEITLTKDRF